MNKLKIFIYSLTDILTFYKGIKRRINGYIIRFPARWSKYYTNEYEKGTVDFFRKTVRSFAGRNLGIY